MFNFQGGVIYMEHSLERGGGEQKANITNSSSIVKYFYQFAVLMKSYIIFLALRQVVVFMFMILIKC